MKNTDGINWNTKVNNNGKDSNMYQLFGEFRELFIHNGHDPVTARELALNQLREISKPESPRPNRHDR